MRAALHLVALEHYRNIIGFDCRQCVSSVRDNTFGGDGSTWGGMETAPDHSAPTARHDAGKTSSPDI